MNEEGKPDASSPCRLFRCARRRFCDGPERLFVHRAASGVWKRRQDLRRHLYGERRQFARRRQRRYVERRMLIPAGSGNLRRRGFAAVGALALAIASVPSPTQAARGQVTYWDVNYHKCGFDQAVDAKYIKQNGVEGLCLVWKYYWVTAGKNFDFCQARFA